MVILCIILVSSLVVLYFVYLRANDRTSRIQEKLEEQEVTNKAVEDSYTVMIQELVDTKETLKKTISQKKSSEVRTGLVSENSLAFMNTLPYNFQNMRFLGSPIDYIYFNFEGHKCLEVVIVEVKSGKSRESKKQREIRKTIEQGNVRYEVVRVGESGCFIEKSK